MTPCPAASQAPGIASPLVMKGRQQLQPCREPLAVAQAVHLQRMNVDTLEVRPCWSGWPDARMSEELLLCKQKKLRKSLEGGHMVTVWSWSTCSTRLTKKNSSQAVGREVDEEKNKLVTCGEASVVITIWNNNLLSLSPYLQARALVKQQTGEGLSGGLPRMVSQPLLSTTHRRQAVHTPWKWLPTMWCTSF